MLVESSM